MSTKNDKAQSPLDSEIAWRQWLSSLPHSMNTNPRDLEIEESLKANLDEEIKNLTPEGKTFMRDARRSFMRYLGYDPESGREMTAFERLIDRVNQRFDEARAAKPAETGTVKHGKPGAKPVALYDEAYKMLKNKKPMAEVRQWYFEKAEIASPNEDDRKAFAQAMRRRKPTK